ncbi:PQQ-binding-like beta-propeller repeat protein [Dactylosporangium sp. NPDC000244]|uniref:outer membrane protein assembly factor BamB family protein n=1 Tax=Dactylosporangium sp. NPDC000244 TaxID=3154365 RepID=UPI0033212AC5
MPDAIIELDLSVPWEPPERPGPAVARRRRGWRRALLGVVVLGIAAVLPGGADHRPGLEPLWTAEFQVLAFDTAGGRILVHRYRTAGADPLIEALDARTGRVLWQRAGAADESYVAFTGRSAIAQVERADTGGAFQGWVAGFDAATGAQRWQRERARFAGLAGDIVVVQELAWPGEEDKFDTSYGNPDDPAVALPRVPHHERYLGLDERTGTPRWTAELAPGTESWLDYAPYPRLRGLRELDRDGALRVRDPAGGDVTGRFRLDFAGVVSRHQAGLPGQELVLPAGRGGTQVFDLASGRRLWTWAGESPAWNGPVPCLRVHYCVFGDGGTDVLDAATGAVLWRAPGYSALLGDTGDRLVMFRPAAALDQPDDVAAFPAGRGGGVAWERRGWFLANGPFEAPGTAAFVWRPAGTTDAIVGRLDPGDGSVHVIGRAPDFYGTPQCSATADRVVCLAIGVLYVWRLR